jgi:hypothetical protein
LEIQKQNSTASQSLKKINKLYPKFPSGKIHPYRPNQTTQK